MKQRAWILAGLVAGFSGFYSLVYQVVWDRVMRFNLGGDTVASAIVTSSFLLGLGIGAWLFGSWHERPARTLGFLEVGIGLFAMASYDYLAPLATNLGRMLGGSLDETAGLHLAVITGAIVFLVPPSILMGGTLPLMFNTFIRGTSVRAGSVGFVYGLNTLGAAAGVVAAPFLLLNHLDIPTTLRTIGLVDVLFGATLVVFSGRIDGIVAKSLTTETGRTPATATAPDRVESWRPSMATILALSFCSGALVLGVEISLLRHFFVFSPSSPYNFPRVLLPFLVGLAVGSVLLTRTKKQSTSALLARVGGLFITAQLLQILAVWAVGADTVTFREMATGQRIWHWVSLTFPFAFASGGVFPLLLRVASSDDHTLPRRTGSVYLASSVGAFTVALFIQFVAFGAIGARGVLLALTYAGIFAGIACLWLSGTLRARPLVAAAVATSLVLPILVPRHVWDAYVYRGVDPGIMAEEGSSGIATIHWNADRSEGGIQVNGQYMSALPDHPKHVRLAAFTLMQPRRSQILVLGLGGGGMIRELLKDPLVQHVDAVDWSNELIAVLEREPARLLLQDALQSPRVSVYANDARVAVSLLPEDSYDIVVDNLAIGSWVGATTIKSKQYYAEVARILKPRGIFIYDSNTSGPEQRAANLAALSIHFRNLWEHDDGIWLASDEDLDLDSEHLEALLEPRAESIGLQERPYSNWILDQLRPVTKDQLVGIEPIRDELLVHEYRSHPFCGWLHGS